MSSKEKKDEKNRLKLDLLLRMLILLHTFCKQMQMAHELL
jgi:hypothetical protein